MNKSYVDGVRLSALACAVPTAIVTADEDAKTFGEAEMQKVVHTTGIRQRRVAPQGICTSDLCVASAERLFAATECPRESIDVVIVVTQTPDYYLPATSCSIHSRLGLSRNCGAFDVNLGCSGYTYGLWIAAHMIAGGAARRVLLLAGEIASRNLSPLDRSAKPLFGDAGTATLLDADPTAKRMWFRYGSDGSGQNQLMIPAGGIRLPRSPATAEPKLADDGNTRSLDDLYMNGAEVFLFTLGCVPELLKSTIADAGWTKDQVDAFVLHQANKFMLEHLAKSAKVPLAKLPMCLKEFGNTSSASIPLTMGTTMRDRLLEGPAKLVLVGFGVGLSWASVAIETDRLIIPPLVEVDCDKLLAELFSMEADSTSHLSESVRKAFHVQR